MLYFICRFKVSRSFCRRRRRNRPWSEIVIAGRLLVDFKRQKTDK